MQQALAALKNRPKPSLPMPSKRSSVLNRSPDRDNDDSGNYFKDQLFTILLKHRFLLILYLFQYFDYNSLKSLTSNIFQAKLKNFSKTSD